MKKKLTALLLCVGVLGFGIFGNINKLEETSPTQHQMVDPGGS